MWTGKQSDPLYTTLPTLQDFYTRRCTTRARKIIIKDTHHLAINLQWLPSGSPLPSCMAKTGRLMKSWRRAPRPLGRTLCPTHDTHHKRTPFICTPPIHIYPHLNVYLTYVNHVYPVWVLTSVPSKGGIVQTLLIQICINSAMTKEATLSLEPWGKVINTTRCRITSQVMLRSYSNLYLLK